MSKLREGDKRIHGIHWKKRSLLPPRGSPDGHDEDQAFRHPLRCLQEVTNELLPKSARFSAAPAQAGSLRYSGPHQFSFTLEEMILASYADEPSGWGNVNLSQRINDKP